MCLTTCVSVSLIIRRCTVTFTTLRLHQQSPPHTVLQSMIESNSQILLQPVRKVTHHSILTALTCQWNIHQIYLMLLRFRTSFRHFIHQVQFSMHSLVRSFLHGSLQQISFVRLLKTIDCHIIHCHQHIQYVRSMDT